MSNHCAGPEQNGQPLQAEQLAPKRSAVWVVQKEYEFAVEVTAGPPTSVFCHSKVSIQHFACPIPATVQPTWGDWNPEHALLLWIAAIPLTITAMLQQ